MNVDTLNASQILGIAQPEGLFGTPDAIHDCYRSLARRWHPDRPAGDAAVFTHINLLHTKAKELAERGTWHVPGLFEFSAEGKQYRIRYMRVFDFELGKMFIGKTLVTYVITKEFADLAENARTVIAKLRFPEPAP